jgi:hypothetical protein
VRVVSLVRGPTATSAAAAVASLATEAGMRGPDASRSSSTSPVATSTTKAPGSLPRSWSESSAGSSTGNEGWALLVAAARTGPAGGGGVL